MSPEVAKAFEITKQVVLYVESFPRATSNRAIDAGHCSAEFATRSWDAWARGDSLMSLVDLIRIAGALNMRVDQLLLAATGYSRGSDQAPKPSRSPR